MAGTQSDLSDGEKWQRAEAYIEQQIESHQRAIDAGGLGFDELYAHYFKRDIYQTILDRAENVPKNP